MRGASSGSVDSTPSGTVARPGGSAGVGAGSLTDSLTGASLSASLVPLSSDIIGRSPAPSRDRIAQLHGRPHVLHGGGSDLAGLAAALAEDVPDGVRPRRELRAALVDGGHLLDDVVGQLRLALDAADAGGA